MEKNFGDSILGDEKSKLLLFLSYKNFLSSSFTKMIIIFKNLSLKNYFMFFSQNF